MARISRRRATQGSVRLAGAPHAEIIAVGTEMLGAGRPDTNSLHLAGELAALGVDVSAKHVVGDDPRELGAMLRAALRRCPIVIVTGGLGPTEDDVTRETVARTLRRPLQEDPELVARLIERFRRHGHAMPSINRKQALVPRGATVVENTAGTAPGLLLPAGRGLVLLLPGPPREMRAVWNAARPHILARLPSGPRPAFATHRINVVGLTESRVDEIAAPIYRRHASVRTTILFSAGQIELHLRGQGKSAAAAARRCRALATRLTAALGHHVLGEGEVTLPEVVVRELTRRGERVSLAESCTGGLIAHRLTSIPGASAVLDLGIVTYADWAKTRLLGVDGKALAAHGAVSEQVVVQMAEHVRAMADATWGIAVSGIAGPSGGTEDKPVGTTWIALASAEGTKATVLRLPGDRAQVTWLASQAALNQLRLALLGSSRTGSGDRPKR